MPYRKNNKSGFTLLEILLVIGIIAILAGIVIVAINPGRQLAKIRNTERRSDIRQIHSALEQYYIDNSHYLTALTTTATEICNTGNATSTHDISCGSLIDLSVLVPTYLVAIPTDPTGEISTNGAGYKVALNASRKLYLQASQAEVNETIVLGSEAGVAGTDWDIPAGWTTPTVTGTARYWVANSTGNWNDTANWSATSGGTGGASVPGSTNDAIFDGDGDGNCTINATVNVKGLILEGYHGTISQGAYAVTVGADGYSQGSGTFTGSGTGSAMTINGIYKLMGGTFTATAGTLSVYSTFTKTGGTLNNGSGTIHIQGGFNITSGGAVFNNLSLYAAGPLTIMDNITVNGNFNLANNYGSILSSGSNSISITGNITGWNNWGGTAGTLPSLILNGSANQTVTNFSSPTKAINVLINKSSGTVYLGSNFSTSGSLTINSGNVLDISPDNGTTNYTLTTGAFTNNGTFYARSATHSFYGTFTNAGTINAGTGTIHIQGGFNITSGGTIFNNLSLYASGVLTLLDDITVSGNLNLMNNYGVLSASGTKNLYIAGNITRWAVHWTIGVANDLNVILNGSGDQTVTNFSDPNRTVDFTLSKSSGTVYLGSNFSTGGTTTINAGNTLNKMGYTLTGTVVNNGTVIP